MGEHRFDSPHVLDETGCRFEKTRTGWTMWWCPLHAAAPDLLAEAMNRKHYSNSPGSVLHSWNDQEPLEPFADATCGLCAAIAKAKGEA